MASGGSQSPPPPPPPATASSEEEEEDGDAGDGAQPAGFPGHQIQQRFEEMCSRLNMDEAARAEAWSSYRSMSESYTLEVRAHTVRGGRGLGWLWGRLAVRAAPLPLPRLCSRQRRRVTCENGLRFVVPGRRKPGVDTQHLLLSSGALFDCHPGM